MQTKHGDGLFKRAAEILDIPNDVAPGISRIEICGNNELLIENHKGILEYDENFLTVNIGRHLLKIEGDALRISSMDDSGLRLRGNISSVSFNPV